MKQLKKDNIILIFQIQMKLNMLIYFTIIITIDTI